MHGTLLHRNRELEASVIHCLRYLGLISKLHVVVLLRLVLIIKISWWSKNLLVNVDRGRLNLLHLKGSEFTSAGTSRLLLVTVLQVLALHRLIILLQEIGI